jgi:arsenate reductase-like glutaredoxin family protein
MRIYLLKTCDTCRKALKELRAAGHQPEVVELREDGLAADDIARFHAAFGDALVNRRSTTWRNLAEAERAGAPQALLAAHPTLMKRPVIETGAGRLHLGWDAATRAAVLDQA